MERKKERRERYQTLKKSGRKIFSQRKSIDTPLEN
jgi:hypothetical protein